MPEISRFDVVVVGGGPAGLAAAISVSGATASVALIDEGPAVGGQIWRRDIATGYLPVAQDWVSTLADSPVVVLGGTLVVDARTIQGRHRLLLDRGGASAVIESATVILATGARELFLPFPGWTLPGVVGVGGAQAMMKQGLRVAGTRAVVAGSGPLLLAVAAALAKRGAEVVNLVEQASAGRMLTFGARAALRPSVALDALRYLQELRGGVVRYGSWVAAAHGARGVESVTIADSGNTQRVDCDLLCTGYGLVPNTELARLLECQVTERGIAVDSHQRTSVAGVFAAGECAGIGGVDVAVIEGLVAGQTAVGSEPSYVTLRRRDGARRWGDLLERTFRLRPELLDLAKPGTIVCRCEDVRRRDIDPTWTSRQAKLYSRAGMGSCQGRVCGAALRRIHGWEADSVRVPLQPVPLSSLASAEAGKLSGAL